MILDDAGYYHFQRLLRVIWVEHCRLVEIQVLFRDLAIIHHEFEIRILVFGIGLSQADADRPSVRKLLGLVDIELVVIALTLSLQHYDLIVRFRD